MNRRTKVEIFEQLRRDYEAGGTIREVAKKHGVHRRMVRQAIANAVPPERRKPRREQPKIGPVKEFIDQILSGDKDVWRKQRHSAHRIWTRLCEEHPEHPIGEATVRAYVRRRKIEMNTLSSDVFVPQSYAPAQEAQVDWFEADVWLAGELKRLQVFGMRSMFSGGAFHRAYTNTTQQSLLEGHEHAFAYFGGVFHLLRYANLSAAVKKVLRGHQREETQRMIAFRSHWGFQSDYCTPGAGHEKGGIEGEVGRFRRNCMVPVPEAGDMDKLNEMLLERSRLSERRTNGTVVTNPQLERAAKTIADHQIIEAIRAIRAEADAVCVPALQYLERAAVTSKTLGERVFSKLGCLARVSAGFAGLDAMAYRAHCKTLVAGAEAITLHRMAQAAIDRGAPQDLILLYAILNENIKLDKSHRAFMNQSLLELVEPEEWRASNDLLAEILDMQKDAGAAYARLSGNIGQSSIARISRGLAAVKLDKDGIPLAGLEE